MAPWLDAYLEKHIEQRVQALVKERMLKELPLVYTTAAMTLNAMRDAKQIGEIAASSVDVKQMVHNVVTEAAQSGRIFLYSNGYQQSEQIKSLQAQIFELNQRIEELHMNFVLKSDLFHDRNKWTTRSR